MSHVILSNREHFLVISGNFQRKLGELPLTISPGDKFFGYCFQNANYHHYHFQTPNLGLLFESYDTNCGVFCCVKCSGSTTEVFTDPLGQYPVFYVERRNELVVSNNFWLIAYLLKGEFNDECAFDYLSYFSPLRNDTILRGVKRLRAFETIRIEQSIGVTSRPYPVFTRQNYHQLIEDAAQRIRLRARAVLKSGTPLVHLSGGSDSRLSFSSLAAEQYTGPVFSFGDGHSQDRLIFEHLVERYSLQKGSLKWFHPGKQDGHHFMRAVHAFQAFKSNSFSNWGPGRDDGYMEVTGYFGEGLLKGYGDLWSWDGRLTIFDFAKTVSVFPEDIFDHSLARVQRDLDILFERANGSRRMANSLFYINNRSAAHFGMHSVVNNMRFRSVDIIYDPLLLHLLYNCPHTDEQIKSGSLIVDLIRTVHSDDLAHFPYENRTIPTFDRKSKRARRGRGSFWFRRKKEVTCFDEVRFDPKEIAPLKPDLVSHPDETLHLFRKYPLKYIGQRELYKNDLFDVLFNDLPALKSARYADVQNSERPAEFIALSTLAIGRWLIERDDIAHYM